MANRQIKSGNSDRFYFPGLQNQGFHGGSDSKVSACNEGDLSSIPGFLPGKSHGWRSLVGYSPWDRKESDMTEQLHKITAVTTAMQLRHLLLRRKTMTNLDSVLKSRDITLLTNVYIVKAMVFPVVRYECESWTIKKAE